VSDVCCESERNASAGTDKLKSRADTDEMNVWKKNGIKLSRG
jgi:hypothetical protein